ncbi:hypothetical protein Pelo_12072 [Pelomyxa schiedti]|nr:hypothetical protein Pelo_12072 [Pelomyxa schiedti]
MPSDCYGRATHARRRFAIPSFAAVLVIAMATFRSCECLLEGCEVSVACVEDNAKCRYEGGTCPINATSCCLDGHFCISGKCKLNSNGLPCNSTGVCYPTSLGSRVAGCVGGVCRLYANAGDSCDSVTLPCYPPSECVNATCTSLPVGSTCVPSPDIDSLLPWRSPGVSCSQGDLCVPDSYGAVTGTCVSTLIEGDACSQSTAPCGPNLICDLGLCTELYSKQENESCSGEYICDPPLQCINSTCTKDKPNSLHKCSASSDCSADSYCRCSDYTGYSYCDIDPHWICQAEEKEMYTCLASNCPAVYFSEAQGSCQNSQCEEAQDKFNKCTLCNYEMLVRRTCIPIKIQEEYCPALELWEKLIILSSIGAAVVVIVSVIMLCCCCGRQKYPPQTII